MSSPATAQLSQFQWQNRLVLIFAPNDQDQRLSRTVQGFRAETDDVLDRDLRILAIVGDTVTDAISGKIQGDLDANAMRILLRTADNTFRVFLIGKDGDVKFRSETPIAPTAIF